MSSNGSSNPPMCKCGRALDFTGDGCLRCKLDTYDAVKDAARNADKNGLPKPAKAAMVTAAMAGMGKVACSVCEKQVPFNGRCCDQYHFGDD